MSSTRRSAAFRVRNLRLPSLAQLCAASAQPNGILTDLPSIIDHHRNRSPSIAGSTSDTATHAHRLLCPSRGRKRENKTYSEQIYRVHSKTAKGMHLANDESNTKKQQLKNSHMV
jgi:hypothetical protein